MQKPRTLLGAALLLGLAMVGTFGSAYAQGSQGTQRAQQAPHDGPFADVPREDRAYRNLKTVEDLWINDPHNYQKRGASAVRTRNEFAGIVVLIAERLPRLNNSTATPSVLTALRDLSEEFRPEIERLGVSMGVIQEQLANRVPFPNMPEKHWAAASVERLRKAGILIGDPNGNF